MDNKNDRIKQSLANTRMKRSGQRCVVYKFKINESKLNSKQKNQLKMMFVEGKWLYNYIVANIYENENFNLFEFNPLKMDKVQHKDKDGNDIFYNQSPYKVAGIKDEKRYLIKEI